MTYIIYHDVLSSLQEEEDMYLKVYDYCDAVIHLESSHTRVPQKTVDDKDTIEIIQR